ncbi:hypothetical protein ACFTE1_16960 [Salininema proteolyticum]|uniref:hypothetical protein n=1 Tax=Salininema proteolyticum TaxID=1607685 RepID=UPI0036322707
MSDEEVGLARSWEGGAVVQVFDNLGVDGATLHLKGVADELEYDAEVTMGAEAAESFAGCPYLFARLLPVGGLWVLSGTQLRFEESDAQAALRWAADWATRFPSTVFRNPEFLAKGWDKQKEDSAEFTAYFGSDTVVFPVGEAADRIREFWLHRHGAALGEKFLRDSGFDLSAHDLTGVETVGLMYDELDGLRLLYDYGRLLDVFAEPRLVRRHEGRRVVESYLKDDETGPVPLRRAAERNPDHADIVFAHILKRKDFSWARDGEKLLERHMPESFRTPPLPRQLPLPRRLAEAFSSSQE